MQLIILWINSSLKSDLNSSYWETKEKEEEEHEQLQKQKQEHEWEKEQGEKSEVQEEVFSLPLS